METQAPHGTPSRYNNGGCRCESCRSAWAQYITGQRRKNGVRSRQVAQAAKRMGLTRRRGESASAFKRRLSRTRAWLRSDAYYADRGPQEIKFRPTSLGLRILEEVQARTGRDHDDIVEQLLRTSGMSVSFDEPPTAQA